MNSYNSGESFIDHIYQELINTEEVKKAIQRKGVNPKNREEAVRYYMERMQHAHNTQRKIDILKRFYYKKYVIDHLPESYVERQWRIAREQGHGNIRITDEMKRKMLEEIQSEQKKSIDRWLDYLNSADAMYPMWFKYYAFQGMIKLGKFDKEKKKFGKRTKDTTNPFIEVNPEILGQMYTILSKMIEKQELTEEEIKALEKGESFQKLYTSLLIQMEENRLANGTDTEGIWIKYEQGDNYKDLWKSLQGKNTGWCTAGEEMCKTQIKNGDFYVYYTYDKDGNATEPRIAIRMQGNYKIAEVRGIGRDQNLEPEMVEIVETKLKEFPNNEGQIYQKKVHDMNLLTEIERKTSDNEELTQEEIIFLYELETYIEGFGWETDPRIKEIKRKRNQKEDIKKIDRETFINLVKKNSYALKYVPTSISNYEEIVLEAVKKDRYALKHVPKRFRFKTSSIALEIVRENGKTLKYVPTGISNYEKIAMEAVRENGEALCYVPIDFPNYEEIALDAVRSDARVLASIPTTTSNYEELVLEVTKNYPKPMLIISHSFRFKKPEIALEAVRENGEALYYVPIDFPNYEEIVLESIKHYRNALKYVSKSFKFKKPEIAMEVVRENGEALYYVPADMPSYEHIAMEAIKQNVSAIRFIPSTIPNYELIAREAIKQNPNAIKYVSSNTPNYEQIALEAVRQNLTTVRFIRNYEQILLEYIRQDSSKLKSILTYMPATKIASEAIRINPQAIKYVPLRNPKYTQLAMEAVRREYNLIRNIPPTAPNYEQIALEAVRHNAKALRYISPSIPNYERLILAAIKQDKKYIYNLDLDNDFKFVDPFIALEIAKTNGELLKYISVDLINYEQIVMEAVKENWKALQYVPKDLITEEMTIQAVKQNPNALKYVPEDTPGYDELYLLANSSENKDEKENTRKVK